MKFFNTTQKEGDVLPSEQHILAYSPDYKHNYSGWKEVFWLFSPTYYHSTSNRTDSSDTIKSRSELYIKLKKRLSVGVRSVVCEPIFLHEISSIYAIPDNDW